MSPYVVTSPEEVADRLAIRGASRHRRWYVAPLNGGFALLSRHLHEDRWDVAVCGALALRRLDGGARVVVTG